jgi:hypothetical protein
VASSGLEEDHLEVELGGGTRAGDRVRVVVTYRSRTGVPVVGALLGDRTLVAAATMRVEGAPARAAEPDKPAQKARRSSGTAGSTT